MDANKVWQEVEAKLRAIPGVMDFLIVDEKLRSELVAVETSAEENGALGGLMPFVNSGVWETLKRKHCFILVLNSSVLLLGPAKDVVYISDKKGQVIGEYLTPERREEMACRTDVSFLSEDFIFYTNVEPEGEPFFIIPPIPFHFLDCIPEVKNVISGSISTLADDLIRSKLGYGDTKHWTHLVGFELAERT